ncbi:MAG: ferrous iron transport protein A, partial [Caldilineaceae bacterium]|nr:ferrous iron transport protein A [Caldilineaceae bacterium]
DPHGDPIPTKDGVVHEIEGIPLTEAKVGCAYQLARVLMQDSARLTYLGSLGLYPSAGVVLLKRAPFDGPLLIDVAGEHHALAHEMAKYLLVTTA